MELGCAVGSIPNADQGMQSLSKRGAIYRAPGRNRSQLQCFSRVARYGGGRPPIGIRTAVKQASYVC
jgi:hypothetical protein